MIEIIAFAYLTSFTLSSLLAIGTLLMMRRRFTSNKLSTMNTNLAKIGLFWSNAQSIFAPLTETSIRDDQRKALRDFALVALILAFLSVPGFLFLCLFVLSMQVIARPRLEKAAFSSALAAGDLPKPNVQEMVNHLSGNLQARQS